jgi:hypothetical protein
MEDTNWRCGTGALSVTGYCMRISAEMRSSDSPMIACRRMSSSFGRRRPSW